MIVGVYEFAPPFPPQAVHADAVRYEMHGGWVDAVGDFDHDAPGRMLALLRYAQAKRAALEAGGFDFQGVRITTDDHAKVLMLIGAATLGDDETVPFIDKGVNYGNFSGTVIRQILNAMKDFVRSSFETLASVIAGINDGSITSTQQIDEANWPT